MVRYVVSTTLHDKDSGRPIRKGTIPANGYTDAMAIAISMEKTGRSCTVCVAVDSFAGGSSVYIPLDNFEHFAENVLEQNEEVKKAKRGNFPKVV